MFTQISQSPQSHPARAPGAGLAPAPARSWGGPLAVVALVALSGGFLFGYDTAVINGANRYLKLHFQLSPFQEGMAGASAILGCIPGAMAAGFLSDRLGRRKMLFACALLYGVSGLLSAVPGTIAQFLAARFISGLGIGASSMVCPVYVAELAPKAWRGRLGSMFQFGIVSGIFLTLFVNALIQGQGDEAWNAALGWRWMLGAEVVPALFLLAILFAAPESPRWLVEQGRSAEARGILERIGGAAPAAQEISAVQQSHDQDHHGRFTDLFRPPHRRPLLIAVLLMAFSQFSGINAIMYYSTKIFTTAGAGIKDSFSASAVIGLVNLVFTFVAMAFVDRAGRRKLLLTGLAGQVIALSCVGWMFHTHSHGPALLAAIVAFIASFAMALGPVPWIICSEIFPTQMRGRAMSVATFAIWASCYAVAQTFPLLNDHPAIGPALTFWIYGAFSLAAFVFVAALVPETKGRSLEELAQFFRAPPLPKPKAKSHNV